MGKLTTTHYIRHKCRESEKETHNEGGGGKKGELKQKGTGKDRGRLGEEKQLA